ncbi:MAG: diguanylate cyclase [Planctomycetaceae bacterium]|nr:diguanylate cyclase [Planctomycetaceae bacterium]
MTVTDPNLMPMAGVSLAPTAPASAECSLAELHTLLRELEAAAGVNTSRPVFDAAIDDRLARVRLGAASGLFAALQCKNAASAGHSLRVALTCSAWAAWLKLPEADRDAIEVAALLHDIGAIGVPDNVLLKPAALDAEEATLMAQARRMSLEILRRSCASPQVLQIAEHVAAWYDGTRGLASEHRASLPENRSARAQQVPLGSRIIAIVEAFDAMITDHVYRPARSQERAMAELFECAGAQFDPQLVEQFAEFQREDQAALRWDVARRWLRSLDPAMVDSYWELNCVPSPAEEPGVDVLFQGRLLDNMYDAVTFVDAAGRIVLWNRGAERLTGLTGAGLRGQAWRPALLEMSDEKGNLIEDADCPVFTAIRCGAQSLRRLKIAGRGQRLVAVDAHTMPVIDRKGATQGAVLLLHDASSEISLERQCQSLHEKATLDPLTQVANRAEFDRVHAMFVAAHQQQQVPCCLLMCDLDRFKRVNDTYGHQAGDDAIKSLASLLKSSCRPGDLVARYGGEEFVMLCADCDNATAARRAEQVRKALSEVPQSRMNGKTITVSIGVTEVQPGDTPETMLRRADRGLLMAKAKGRNVVVQLGAGCDGETIENKPVSHATPAAPKRTLQQELITPVPVRIAIEKLRGFVADHQAKIVSVDGNRVSLEIDCRAANRLRRLTDRPTALRIDLAFEEQRLQTAGGEKTAAVTTRTKITVAVRPRTNRDRRRGDGMTQAREVLISLRSYLMAVEQNPSQSNGSLKTIARALAPWLVRK